MTTLEEKVRVFLDKSSMIHKDVYFLKSLYKEYGEDKVNKEIKRQQR